jgi:hypothetical protein
MVIHARVNMMRLNDLSLAVNPMRARQTDRRDDYVIIAEKIKLYC